MLIEAVDLAYNVRFDIDGVRLLNGSAFSWASVGKRYNVTFKTLQTTVGIAPSDVGSSNLDQGGVYNIM
jgi:hypothetical protein